MQYNTTPCHISEEENQKLLIGIGYDTVFQQDVTQMLLVVH
jgi:hypothetical protein